MKITPIMFAVFWANAILGQVNHRNAIQVIARESMDSIVLRWAPSSFETWVTANRNGYLLQRYTLTRNGHILPVPIIDTLAKRIAPLNEDMWLSIVERDRYAAISAQALFGKQFEVDLKNDGPLAVFNQVEENEQRFSIALYCADMSTDVARASGLVFTDKSISRFERYLYRVSVIQTDSLDGSCFVDMSIEKPILTPPSKLTVNQRGKIVELRWNFSQSPNYCTFHIERSHDGFTFYRLQQSPVTILNEQGNAHISYAMDTLSDARQMFYYRVRGVTIFGDLGEFSAVVKTTQIRAVQSPPVVSAHSDDNTNVRVRWTFPDSLNLSIDHFEVQRSVSPRFQPNAQTFHLPPFSRECSDSLPEIVNYYRVIAVTSDGETHISLPVLITLVDSIPPLAPRGLSGKIDEYGSISLEWDDNNETDVSGYHVYSSNTSDEEMALLTNGPITGSTFSTKIPLTTLNERVFFAVIAVDRAQNHSLLSRRICIDLPDKIRPSSPVLLPLKTSSENIEVKWIASASTDVKRYDVYHQKVGQNVWARLRAVTAESDSIYAITLHSSNITNGSLITVTAVDDSQLESPPAPPIKVVMHTPSPITPITWLPFDLDTQEKNVVLRWRAQQDNIQSFRVYVSINHGMLQMLRSVDGNARSTQIKFVSGSNYQFAIGSVAKNGSASELSEMVSIQF